MDENKYKREKQKRLLRMNVLKPTAPAETDSLEQDNAAIRKRKIRKALVIAVIAAALLFCIFFAWKRFVVDRTYSDYTIMWEEEIMEGSLYGYEAFGDNVLKYSRDGASYLDASGKVLWNQTYEMRTPIVAINGSYVAIGDQNGNHVVVCNREGPVGSYTTTLPIQKLSVASNGVSALILEGPTANFIHYYDRNGNRLDIEIKSVDITNEGYPLDLSLSPNGTQLITSFVHLEGGIMKSTVYFHNFSEIGKSVNERLVGIIESNSTLVPRVKFINEDYACAIGDNQLMFFSLRNELSPEVLARIDLNTEIQSVFYGNDHIGVIMNNAEGTESSRLFVYTPSGSLVFEKAIDFDYSNAEMGKNMIILTNASECLLLNMSGKEIYRNNFDFEVIKIVENRLPGQLIVTGSSTMKGIQLK